MNINISNYFIINFAEPDLLIIFLLTTVCLFKLNHKKNDEEEWYVNRILRQIELFLKRIYSISVLVKPLIFLLIKSKILSNIKSYVDQQKIRLQKKWVKFNKPIPRPTNPSINYIFWITAQLGFNFFMWFALWGSGLSVLFVSVFYLGQVPLEYVGLGVTYALGTIIFNYKCFWQRIVMEDYKYLKKCFY